jgi:hypothetical protein
MADDPTAGVSALRGIDLVMKAGVIVRDDYARAGGRTT